MSEPIFAFLTECFTRAPRPSEPCLAGPGGGYAGCRRLMSNGPAHTSHTRGLCFGNIYLQLGKKETQHMACRNRLPSVKARGAHAGRGSMGRREVLETRPRSWALLLDADRATRPLLGLGRHRLLGFRRVASFRWPGGVRIREHSAWHGAFLGRFAPTPPSRQVGRSASSWALICFPSSCRNISSMRRRSHLALHCIPNTETNIHTADNPHTQLLLTELMLLF